MNYKVAIIIVRSPGPASDSGMPSYYLPETYTSPLDASEAARIEMAKLDLGLGSATWRIEDEGGSPV